MMRKNVLGAAVLLLALVSMAPAPASANLLSLLPLTPGICSLKIQLKANVDVEILNLLEIQLFLKGNIRILPLDIKVGLSTAVDLLHDAAACIDCNLLVGIKTLRSDPNPHLIVQYPCLGGVTTLSKVVVVNVLDPLYCNRINSYQCSFYNDKGVKDKKSYFFAGGLPLYLINVDIL